VVPAAARLERAPEDGIHHGDQVATPIAAQFPLAYLACINRNIEHLLNPYG
jgi:hypothetical protein